jgi:hypothetical protein
MAWTCEEQRKYIQLLHNHIQEHLHNLQNNIQMSHLTNSFPVVPTEKYESMFFNKRLITCDVRGTWEGGRSGMDCGTCGDCDKGKARINCQNIVVAMHNNSIEYLH